MMLLQRHIEWTTSFEKIDTETKTMVNWKGVPPLKEHGNCGRNPPRISGVNFQVYRYIYKNAYFDISSKPKIMCMSGTIQ